MQQFLPTLVFRHRRENLKKCSLRGLETRGDFCFFTYPDDPPPAVENYLLLSLEGEILTKEDGDKGLILLDGTWSLASVMEKQLFSKNSISKRALPKTLRTAYPRRQTGCLLPDQGLASIEALYVAYLILERDREGLLDHYYWKSSFLDNLTKIHI